MDLTECQTCHALVPTESLSDHHEWHSDTRTFLA